MNERTERPERPIPGSWIPKLEFIALLISLWTVFQTGAARMNDRLEAALEAKADADKVESLSKTLESLVIESRGYMTRAEMKESGEQLTDAMKTASSEVSTLKTTVLRMDASLRILLKDQGYSGN